MNDEPALLTATQVAKWLGISRTQVYRLIRSGELPTVPIGKDKRVTRAAINAWLARHSRLPE